MWLISLGILVAVAGQHAEDVSKFFRHEGETVAGNLTLIHVKADNPMRIVVQSMQGDADIYWSKNSALVSFDLDLHDLSSTTCGLDYIDVPATGSESFMAVYGHPSHALSVWRLLVIPGENSTWSDGEFPYEAEFIYEWWERMEEDEEYPLLHLIIDILLELFNVFAPIFL